MIESSPTGMASEVASSAVVAVEAPVLPDREGPRSGPADLFARHFQRAQARAIWFVRLVLARLRFLLVIGIGVAIVSQWDLLTNLWDRWTTSGARSGSANQVVSSDTEYFCPMDPGILSDWPSKCPVCNMSLVRRKRGDSAPLPEGVVARMQLSPYQLHLGGIRTSVAEYRPLERTIDAVGQVSGTSKEASGSFRVELDLFDSDCEWLAVGQAARIWTSAGIEPLPGRVESIGSLDSESRTMPVRVVASAPPDSVTEGQRLRVRVLCPAADAEPFLSQPVNVPPLREKEPRFTYACPDHPDSIQTRAGRCPIDDQMLGKHALDVSERLRYWCPMHPNFTADEPGANCAECGGMELVGRVISFRPAGQVLSIPETAIVDSGSRRVVFVERMAGEFEGIEVEIGPRCGDYFPVIRGLSRGARVVAVGAFLLDAETRLNPSLAAGYFGATGKRSPLQSARDNSPLESLTEADRSAALAQRDCPVTGKALGSMGTPVRQLVEGRVVFLCCAGCEGSLKANPGMYLAKLDAGKAKNRDTQPAAER